MFRMARNFRRRCAVPCRPRRGDPWRPARLAAVVVEELAHQIISGALREGDVLPTEPALCEQFGFSRTVIREGLKLLEERGLVRVEQGRGTTVQPRDSWNLLDPVVLRIALEYDHDMSLARQPDHRAAGARARDGARPRRERLTDEELAALAENIEQMEASYDDYERFRAFDLAFHAIVMKASGNEVGLTIVRAIHRHGGVSRPLASAASSRDRARADRAAITARHLRGARPARDGELRRRADRRRTSRSAWAERKDRAVSRLDNLVIIRMMIIRDAHRSSRRRPDLAPRGHPAVRVAAGSPRLRPGPHDRGPADHDGRRRGRRGLPRVERADARRHRRPRPARRARRRAGRPARVALAPALGARPDRGVPDLALRRRRRRALGSRGPRPRRSGAPPARHLPRLDPGVRVDDDVLDRRGVPRRRRPVPRARLSRRSSSTPGGTRGRTPTSASACGTTSGPTST